MINLKPSINVIENRKAIEQRISDIGYLISDLKKEKANLRLAIKNCNRLFSECKSDQELRELATIANILPELNTPRHLMIVRLMTKGMSEKQIADQLFITRKGVSNHRTNIFKVVKVNTRYQLLALISERISAKKVGESESI